MISSYRIILHHWQLDTLVEIVPVVAEVVVVVAVEVEVAAPLAADDIDPHHEEEVLEEADVVFDPMMMSMMTIMIMIIILVVALIQMKMRMIPLVQNDMLPMEEFNQLGVVRAVVTPPMFLLLSLTQPLLPVVLEDMEHKHLQILMAMVLKQVLHLPAAE